MIYNAADHVPAPNGLGDFAADSVAGTSTLPALIVGRAVAAIDTVSGFLPVMVFTWEPPVRYLTATACASRSISTRSRFLVTSRHNLA